jgi:hypothetical protein
VGCGVDMERQPQRAAPAIEKVAARDPAMEKASGAFLLRSPLKHPGGRTRRPTEVTSIRLPVATCHWENWNLTRRKRETDGAASEGAGRSERFHSHG